MSDEIEVVRFRNGMALLDIGMDAGMIRKA